MGLSLTIDQGNSSAKVAVWDQSTPTVLANYEALTDDVISNLIARYNIDKAIYSSVAEHHGQLLLILQQAGIRTMELNRPHSPTYSHRLFHSRHPRC